VFGRRGVWDAALRHDSRAVHAWLFLALAHQRRGQGDEARKCLARAVQLIEHTAKTSPKLEWHRRLATQVLRREAEQQIQGKTADPGK
jgi:hypothetical protein